jgi:cell division transport system permease protein
MAEEIESARRKRFRLAHISTVISITLVLFMSGLLAGIVVFADELSRYVKEKFTVEVFLQDGITEETRAEMLQMLQNTDGVKEVKYTDKEQAKVIYQEIFSDDFSDILDQNPLYASFTVTFHADAASAELTDKLDADLQELYGTDVVEVFKKRELAEEANRNLEKLAVLISVVAVLLLLIVVALINNTIRLAIYSQRFTIKTMQLVGATPRFIRRPFILGSVGRGLLSGLLACGLLVVAGIQLRQNFPEFADRLGIIKPAGILIFVIAMGLFISGLSTRLAVNVFLRKKAGDLY